VTTPESISGMEHPRPRWRFRISTLMLLVVIVALAFALGLERVRRARLQRELEAHAQRFRAERWQARMEAQVIQVQAQYDRELLRKIQEAERRPDAGAPGGTGKPQQ
jgi:HAMP domain-containing protein